MGFRVPLRWGVGFNGKSVHLVVEGTFCFSRTRCDRGFESWKIVVMIYRFLNREDETEEVGL